jgi:hypothetical protein
MNAIEQLTAISLLADFLFGVTVGVIGGAVIGSRRGTLLWPAADGLLGAGARVIYGVCTRDDDGYLRGIARGGRQEPGKPRGDDGRESRGREVD